MMFYHKSDKEWTWEDCFYATPFGGPDLFLIWDYDSVHAISAVMKQADARMKKVVRPNFSGFELTDLS